MFFLVCFQSFEASWSEVCVCDVHPLRLRVLQWALHQPGSGTRAGGDCGHSGAHHAEPGDSQRQLFEGCWGLQG